MKLKFVLFLSLALTLAGLRGATSGPTSTQLVASAKRAVSEGNKNLAIYYYLEALKQEPARVDWRLMVAQALQKRGNDPQALAEARTILKYQPANAAALAMVADLTKVKRVKTKAEIEAEEETFAINSVPFPDKSLESLPRALAAWVMGEPALAIEKINAHNLSVAKTQQIYYFFVPAGELAVNGHKLALSFDVSKALALFDGLNTDARVFPIIKGASRNIAKIPPEEWLRVAQEIGSKVEAEAHLGGVMFDISPHQDVLHLLYASVKKSTKKPLFAVGGGRLTFKYTDVGVAKCFDFGNSYNSVAGMQSSTLAQGAYQESQLAIPNMEAYAGSVEATVNQVLKNARAMGGKVLIGVPFIATQYEYASRASSSAGEQKSAGVKMDQYISNAIGWTESNVQVNDDAFLGLAIWAIHPDGGVHIEPDPHWYFPSLISPELWERMKHPLVNR